MNRKSFGKTSKGVEAFKYEIANAKGMKADNEQLHFVNGCDHNFAIDKTTEGVERVATAYCPASDIKMDVLTDCIGIQLYTGNFIAGKVGKGGVTYVDNGAYCLETQYFPNAINEVNFVTPITKAGEVYETKTIHKFTVELAGLIQNILDKTKDEKQKKNLIG